MRKQEIKATGIISKEGQLNMYMGEINDFFASNKGLKVIASFKVIKKDASAALKGYYFNYVVPVFKQAIWETGDRKTEEETELFLREISPVMKSQTVNEETGKYVTELLEISDLNNPELIEHIDTLKLIAAEEYGLFIEDPSVFTKSE
jgi:hypothetical protein